MPSPARRPAPMRYPREKASVTRGVIVGVAGAAAVAWIVCMIDMRGAHSRVATMVKIGPLDIARIRYGPAMHVRLSAHSGLGWWLLAGALTGACINAFRAAADRAYTKHIHNLD